MTRIAINLSNKILKELDEVLKENGYYSRFKGIENALKEHILHHQKD